ncbi:MAG TPA: GAF domain-containing protein [Myxococcales bacterium]|jgi:GAF domain-containing protein|nr:GAF domain-containing protein [Myxococcales bacterium]
MARTEVEIAAAALRAAVEHLHRAFARHSWTGIYFLRSDELVLGPFVGPPTEHVRIPRGRGLCGRAVREEKDLNVADVASQPEYLACSADVRSELIVLVRDRGEIVGQIDIDSREAGAFPREHERAVRAVADAIAPLVRLVREGA